MATRASVLLIFLLSCTLPQCESFSTLNTRVTLRRSKQLPYSTDDRRQLRIHSNSDGDGDGMSDSSSSEGRDEQPQVRSGRRSGGRRRKDSLRDNRPEAPKWLTLLLPLAGALVCLNVLFGRLDTSEPNFYYYQSTYYEKSYYDADGQREVIKKESTKSNIPIFKDPSGQSSYRISEDSFDRAVDRETEGVLGYQQSTRILQNSF